jgi:RNA polymerase sigma-70 factor (ECF subfamily)
VTPELAFEDPTFEPELFEAVRRLPYRYRVIVMARFFLDWSVEQTATALELPTGTVKTRQRRALQRLGKALGDPQ